MKKLIIVLLFTLVIPQLVVAQTATAPTIAELQAKVLELTRILESLKAQLAARGQLPAPTWLPPSENLPPVINSITGPTSLAIGASGTWQVVATDPEESALTYSVFWGDLSQPTIQNTNFLSHSYSVAGNYYLTFVASDRGGKSVRGNAAVFVSNRDVSAVTGSAEISAADGSTGELIAGASITLLNLSGQVAGTGVTRVGSGVVFNNLPIGAYTALAVAVGYRPSQITFSVIRDQTAKPVVRLEKIPVSTLTVKVNSNAGSPLGNAWVTIYGESNLPVAARQTDASGTAAFSNLPTDKTYRAEVFLFGYVRPNSQSATLSSASGGAATLNFTLVGV